MHDTFDAPKNDLAGHRSLVIGGSGFIGTHLSRRLFALGSKVVSIDLKPPRENIPGIEYVIGDVREISLIDLPEVDSIWNLAAVHTTPGHPDYEYYDTNVHGAVAVTEFASQRGVADLVFTSSISVYGPSEERKTELSRPDPQSAYGRSKFMAEKIHSAWQAELPGRRLTIVRPAVVFGHGEGGNFARMASLLKKGIFVFPGRRDTIKSCIYVEDLIDLMLAGRSEGAALTTLNGAYPECPTLEQIVLTLRNRYFGTARTMDLPRWLVMSLASAIGALNGFGGIHPDRVTKLLKSTHVYPQWAAERGLLPKGSFELGIERWAAATKETFI